MQSHAKHSRNDSVCYLVPDRRKNMFFSLTTVKSKFNSSLLSLATSTKQYNLFYSRMLMYFSTMFPAFISVHYMCSYHKHFILKTPSGLVSHWWRGPYKRWVGGSDTSLRHFLISASSASCGREKELQLCFFVFSFDLIFETKGSRETMLVVFQLNEGRRFPPTLTAFSVRLSEFCSQTVAC